MQDILNESLRRLKRIHIRKKRIVAVLLVLSLMVSMNVFWVLRQPGWTLAGDADCNITEHTHDEACQNSESPCALPEHIHSISCYADVDADVETQLDWQTLFADYPYTGNLREDLAGIARTQVGYCESTLNFQVGDDGIRRGYTRYGAWYGAPYADWSALFVSFCLHYAGADPAQTPGNTGAASMAEIWKTLDKFAAPGAYDPAVGDLVFFTNNTVGIVALVQNATFYVIRGDVDNSVRTDPISLADASIAGWGLTEGTLIENQPQAEQPSVPELSEPDLLDISNGPAFFILEGSEAQPQIQRYSLKASRAVIDLIPYLEANGGSYFFTLLDKNNQELPKDAAGNYIVQADTGYKLTISFTCHEGFVPGTYQYQIPNGLMVDGGEGTFILKDGTHVGDWVVTDNGLITLNFNEHINSRTDITISATMGILFPEQEDPIDFDGKITVTVEKPDEEKEHTKLNKWGSQGDENKQQDPTKIYWTVEIQGKNGSQIPGSTITDQVKIGDHRFTQSDIDGGLRFGAGEYDLATGEQLAWHAWTVLPGDPNLVWTETGWTYQMPESIICDWCPAPVPLGNDGWIYYIEYTSTPDPAGIPGTIWYTNEVAVDRQQMEGWGSFEHVQAQANIVKNGIFLGDAGGGRFLWEFQATVPGKVPEEKAVYLWQIMDNLRIKNGTNDTIGYVENDANQATVTATRGAETLPIPHVTDAGETSEFAWYNMWSADHGDGIYYGRALVLLSRCHCTAESCQFWDNHSCGSLYWYEAPDGYWYTNGMCHCWTEPKDMTFTFSYETNDPSVIDAYGGQGNDLQNEVLLQNTVYTPEGIANTITFGTATAEVPIPGVFRKELTRDFDGYTANYTITVNEGKLVLTDGSALTIHDAMTPTLAYISGSLVITTEDADGNTAVLQQGVDYTVVYDGTGNATDDHGAPVHTLDIVILHPQPVMYILDYDATLVMPEQVTGGLKYSNSATITLWGQNITDTSAEKVYADINIAAKSYKVEMFKTCAKTGEPLGGAAFGLYNTQGGLITTGITDTKGELLFQTNVVEGIILREHILYYMQELRAPPGYQLDDTKYWFCFCDSANAACDTCTQVMAGTDATRIPFEQIGKVHAVNELMKYALPATGGSGIYPLMLVSVIFIITPLVYGFIQRRKQERRGTG